MTTANLTMKAQLTNKPKYIYMLFKTMAELCKAIDVAIGSQFINDFQYKRKQLKGAGRIAGRHLFGNIHEADEWWAINKGGNTELQYHISCPDDVVYYGLGFNTQYTQFKNDLTPVDYVRPFMNAFLHCESKIREMLPGYDFVIGSKSNLVSPQDNKFTLFGKTVPLNEIGGDYEIANTDFQEMIDDLKRQLPVYELVFSSRSESEKIMHELRQYTDLLTSVKPQIILQGPPGTGKTYTAQEIAHQMVFGKMLNRNRDIRNDELRQLEESDQYAFVQFHPAYDYEDFVRGISVKASGQNVVYEVENRILAQFARRAFDNWESAHRAPVANSRRHQVEGWIQSFQENIDDRIENNESIQLTDTAVITRTTADGVRYNGPAWKVDGGVPYRDLVEMYLAEVQTRAEIKALASLTLSAKGNSTYWFHMLRLFKAYLVEAKIDQEARAPQVVERLKNFVLVIDEINRANLPAVLGELIYALEYRNRKVQSLYEHPLDGRTILMPSNLYLIGTMNTADRSVGNIDYAVRRRFAFIDILPNREIIAQQNLKEATDLFDKVAALFVENILAIPEQWKSSSHLSSDFLAKDVMLGHSYFLAASNEQLELKYRYEILPILNEYIRDGILNKSAEEEIKKISA